MEILKFSLKTLKFSLKILKFHKKGEKELSPSPVRVNKHIRIANPSNSPSQSPTGLSKPQKSIGYSNDFMEFSPNPSRSPKSPGGIFKQKETFPQKPLIFWNKQEKTANSYAKDAQILKEIGTLIKKIQSNADKDSEKSAISSKKAGNLPKNANISEESTRTTFENNMSERNPQQMKQISERNQKIKEKMQEEKGKIALNLLKLKNNQELLLEKEEDGGKNYRTQADFFRKNCETPKVFIVFMRNLAFFLIFYGGFYSVIGKHRKIIRLLKDLRARSASPTIIWG